MQRGAAFGETERAIDDDDDRRAARAKYRGRGRRDPCGRKQPARRCDPACVGEKGHDPRDFALFPLAVPARCTLSSSRASRRSKVLVPPIPTGITSALGCVIADLDQVDEFVHTMYRPLQEVDAGNADDVLAEQARDRGMANDRG